MKMSIETIKEVEQAITTIGFPIICVVFMWKKITTSDERQTELLNKLISAIDSLSEYIKREHHD